MTYRVSNFIDGETTESRSERFGTIFNPATGQQQGQVVLSTAAECQDAIASAERALADWAQTPPLVRARVLFRFKELMEQHRDDLARLISREHGKVFSDAQGELTRGLEVVEFACGIPHLLKGSTPSTWAAGSTATHDAAGGCLRRHHPVQLPGHGAAVDVPGGHRLRQHLHSQALREGSSLSCAWPSCSSRPACRTGCSTW